MIVSTGSIIIGLSFYQALGIHMVGLWPSYVYACRGRDGQDRVLECWGRWEVNISCGGLEMELVVWELW